MHKFLIALILGLLAFGALADTTTTGHISIIDIQSDGTAGIALDSCGTDCFVSACSGGVYFVVTGHDVLYSAVMSARVTERTVTITYDETNPNVVDSCPLINIIVH